MYGSSGCARLGGAPAHTARSIQENTLEVSLGWFCLVETSLHTQAWGTKDVQVIISEVTFPPVQSRKAGREASWGCGPAPASSIVSRQRRSSVPGKTILWFDFLSNHSSSGTGAKIVDRGKKTSFNSHIFKKIIITLILFYLAKTSLLLPCLQFPGRWQLGSCGCFFGFFYLPH